IIDPIASLAGAFASIQSGLAAAARIRETEHLEAEETSRRPASQAPRVPGTRGPAPGAPILALRDVTAVYAGADRPALTGIDLEIPRTGHVALVGPSGAGKTTVLSLLLRFIEPSAGTLELDGVP